ncbi:hypothetical protein SASPL_138190 [Salvia splendens]|uniref:TLC domain-containing protein n=1 Tax=Salvia splendens TaxID=180675 RepID=A0A8X8ZDN3_SALSN|nr:hypothetical protein SASPL_138190 [Salvia splendens]
MMRDKAKKREQQTQADPDRKIAMVREDAAKMEQQMEEGRKKGKRSNENSTDGYGGSCCSNQETAVALVCFLWDFYVQDFVLMEFRGGGLMVYDLTGAISASFFKGYSKLSNKEKLEWNNRGFSTFHSIVVAAGSLYLLLISDLFVDSEDVLFVNKSSTLSETIMGVSIGYFLSDLAMIIYNYPALGGIEYILHHGLSMFSIVQSLLSGQAQFYIFIVLFTEITTPFVNLRWHLDVAGLKNSKLYIYNGVALFIGWLV